MPTLTAKLTSTPGVPPTYNTGLAETFSWVPIDGADRPLFARAGYITNLSDLSISLSAGSISVSDISIKDGNSGRLADVEDAGNGQNALRVLTQDLEPNTDTVSLADIHENNVSVTAATSSLNVHVTNPTTSVEITYANAAQADAFGRIRTSVPTTLFDSSHRFQDNALWSSLTAVNGTYSFNANQGLIDLTVDNTAGSSVIRETTKVFAYQPGKALLTMNTFVFAPSATNLRQRVGYYGTDNGYFVQLDDRTLSFVERTLVNGAPATETIVDRSQWNGDKLDGSGPSGIVLDITKSQILWMDFEWLGVGTVRVGFMIDGMFIVCHSFHHANIVPSTYITTACLPVRYEITNKGPTSGSHTLKQSCTTVISEGGYELRGAQQAIETPIGSPRDLTVAGTYYPIISLRLKPTRQDAIVILSYLSFLGITNNANYNWKLLGRSTTVGGTWVDVSGSSVQYNRTGTSVSGGRVLTSGFTVGSNQGSTPIAIPKDDLFRFQLERDSLNNTYYEITLAAASDSAGADVYASVDWEEVTR